MNDRYIVIIRAWFLFIVLFCEFGISNLFGQPSAGCLPSNYNCVTNSKIDIHALEYDTICPGGDLIMCGCFQNAIVSNYEIKIKYGNTTLTILDSLKMRKDANTFKVKLPNTIPPNTIFTLEMEEDNNMESANFSTFSTPLSYLNYPNIAFCFEGSNPIPTSSPLPVNAGIYSINKSGDINSRTGEMNLRNSAPLLYTVTFTNGCGNSADKDINIVWADAEFYYPDSIGKDSADYYQYCFGPSILVPRKQPSITSFSFLSGVRNDLSFTKNNGQVNIGSSLPGNYIIRNIANTIISGCADTFDYKIKILEPAPPVFSYSIDSICPEGPAPILTGINTGTFSSDNPNIIVLPNGQIDLQNSSPGMSTITQVTQGTCADSHQVDVTLRSPIPFLLDYGTGNDSVTLCQDGVDKLPFISPMRSGYFWADVPSSILALDTNGGIDVSASTVGGPYKVYFTSQDTGCSYTDSTFVTVLARDDASFHYKVQGEDSVLFCKISGSVESPVFTGDSGGIFSWLPDNFGNTLAITDSTGVIDVGASDVGVYTVFYETPGFCNDSSFIRIRIFAPRNPTLRFDSTYYCEYDTDTLSAVVTGSAGIRLFWETTGRVMVTDSANGQFFIGNTPPGNYTVYYKAGVVCPDTVSTTLEVRSLDEASFSYSPPAVCVRDSMTQLIGNRSGTFSVGGAASGIRVNTVTGAVLVGQSQPGSAWIYHQTAGFCPDLDSAQITILPLDTVAFFYRNNSGPESFCQGEAPVQPHTGMFTGYFSSNVPDTILSLDPNTGVIDPSQSISGGPYQVFFTNDSTNLGTSVGCPYTDTVWVSIQPTEDARFYFDTLGQKQVSICLNSGTEVRPTAFGSAGGMYRADKLSGVGDIELDSISGAIDLNSSDAGVYRLIYRTKGPCHAEDSIEVTLKENFNPRFTLDSTEVCSNADSIVPVPLDSGGTWTIIPNDPNIITQEQGASGVYFKPKPFQTQRCTLIYSFNSTGCDAEFERVFDLVAPDTAAIFEYEGDSMPGVALNLPHVCAYEFNGLTQPTMIPSIANQADKYTVVSGNAKFNKTNGSNLNESLDGVINVVRSLDSLVADTSVIKLSLSGVCLTELYDTLVLRQPDVTAFKYDGVPNPANENIACNKLGLIAPVKTDPQVPGFFTRTDGNTSFSLALDSSGIIDLDLSSIYDDYKIQFNSLGLCPDSTEIEFEVAGLPLSITPLEVVPGGVLCNRTPIIIQPDLNAGDGNLDFIHLLSTGRSISNDSLDFPLIVEDDMVLYRTITDNNTLCARIDSVVFDVEPEPAILGRIDASVLNAPEILAGQDTLVFYGGRIPITLSSQTDNTHLKWWLAIAQPDLIRFAADTGITDTVLLGPEDFNLPLNFQLLTPSSIVGVTLVYTPYINGCMGETDSIFTIVLPEEEGIFIPDLITPNGDLNNDEWEIEFTSEVAGNPSAYTLSLYNRSGALVKFFESLAGVSDDPFANQLPDGVYWYILKKKGGDYERRGALAIKRQNP